jgi:hypothetical protein
MASAIPVSPLIKLYLTEKPAEMATHYLCRRTLYCTAAVISAIGAIAIFGGLTAIYLGLLSEGSLSGMEALGVIFGGCLFSHGVSVFSRWQSEAHQQIKWYNQLGAHLHHIGNWDERAVGQFFSAINRSITYIQPPVMDLLRQINPQRPLLALLPLIARYQLTQHYAQVWGLKAAEQTTAMQHINSLPQDARDNIRKIHQSLEASANKEKQQCEHLNAECLGLLMNPINL